MRLLLGADSADAAEAGPTGTSVQCSPSAAQLGRDRVKEHREGAGLSQFRVGSSDLCGKQPPRKP